MNTAELIYQEAQNLPEDEAKEVLDFMRFLRLQRRQMAKEETPLKSGKALYSHLAEQGLIDCMEAEEDLSETYKQQLWK